MNQDDNIRVIFDNYNNTNNPRELQFITNSLDDILVNTDEYLVTIEKTEIPINSQFMPINNDTTPYHFAIFSDDKSVGALLPFGLHKYKIEGPYFSVDELLKQLNDVILKVLGMGTFTVNDEEYITFTVDSDNFPKFEFYYIYFDARLRNLLTFNFNLSDTISYDGIELAKFNEVTVFTPSSPRVVVNYVQKSFTFADFFKLKSIRVYTDLPLVQTLVNDEQTRSVIRENILGDITFNSLQMYRNKNLIYLPDIFRYYSMYQVQNLNTFRIWFRYKYANGEKRAVYMRPDEYCSIIIAFKRKGIL